MTPAQAERVHAITLRILAQVGVRLEHEDIVSRLLQAGAKMGGRNDEVRLPPAMVREYLAMAPPVVDLTGRTGATCVLSAASDPVYWTNPAMYIWDGQLRRKAATHDLAAVAGLGERLPNVSGVMGMALSDVPPWGSDFVGLRVMAANTGKHVRVLCASPAGAEAIKAMKEVFPGAWFSVGFTAHGPLRWTNLALEIYKKTAGKRIPATVNGEPMAGVTGPVSLAGSIAIGNAEIVAGIVVNQILEPGRPLIYNLGLAHVLDMKSITAVTGGPENALFAAASAAMGRFYHIPSASWVSTDAVHEDEQAALEKMFGYHTHAAEGVSLIWGMGQLESELTMSLGQLLIDSEILDYIRHYRQGIAFNDDDLAFSLIEQVDIGGSFLETEHTIRNYRHHLFSPSLLNRTQRENCRATLPERAHQQAQAMLSACKEPLIGSGELAELLEIERFYLAGCAANVEAS